MPMTEAHQRLLTDNRLLLVRNLIVDEALLSIMRRGNVITDATKQEIEYKGRTNRAAFAGALLDELPRSNKSFDRLIEAMVETGQAFLAEVLDPVLTAKHVERMNNPDVPMEDQKAFSHPLYMLDEADSTPDDMKKVLAIIGGEEVMNCVVHKMTNKRRQFIENKGNTIYPSNVREARGHAIIINNEYFLGGTGDPRLEARGGSANDVKNLKNLFTQLHFTVSEPLHGLVSSEFLPFLIEESRRSNLASVDVLVVVIMSHGTRNVVYGKDSKKVLINPDILNVFNSANCPALKDKPKLFIFQACQGNRTTTGVGESSNQANENPEDNSSYMDDDISMYPDTLLSFSSCTGYASWRSELGSWFIRSLVYVFARDAYRLDVMSMLTEVGRIVTSMKTDRRCIQLPATRVTLNKPCYLMPF